MKEKIDAEKAEESNRRYREHMQSLINSYDKE
jgi:hypothetical protein